MASSKKIEEKYQRLLKEIQKRPGNRDCFDCTGRGNQYVVLNFNTLVCTTCSGVHRELQHRIKSVGMSTFSTEEIKELDKGGNTVAASTWLATWTPQELACPSEDEVAKIREYIKAKCARLGPSRACTFASHPPPARPHTATCFPPSGAHWLL